MAANLGGSMQLCSTPAAGTRRFWWRKVAGALGSALAAGAGVRAQEAPPEPVPPSFARITVERAAVRCFASDSSPVFRDVLEQGDVVRVAGPAQNGYRPVTLPLGVTGYVHKKYASEPDAGMVKTTGREVSFRYRPQSGEAPVDRLDLDVPLHWMGEENDWWIVHYPAGVGFVAESQMATDGDAAAFEAGWHKLETERQAEWQAALAAREAARQAAEQQRKNRARLDELIGRFRAEVAKPWEQQQRDQLRALEASVNELRPSLGEGSPQDVEAVTLVQELRKQVLLIDANEIAARPLPKDDEPPVKVSATPDPLARFDAVGWVKVLSSRNASRSVCLSKGGRILCYLVCSGERFDLPMFDGVEVGVIGARDHGARDGQLTVDVQRIEVLNAAGM
jgi:hypothetical protein